MESEAVANLRAKAEFHQAVSAGQLSVADWTRIVVPLATEFAQVATKRHLSFDVSGSPSGFIRKAAAGYWVVPVYRDNDDRTGAHVAIAPDGSFASARWGGADSRRWAVAGGFPPPPAQLAWFTETRIRECFVESLTTRLAGR